MRQAKPGLGLTAILKCDEGEIEISKLLRVLKI